jgi:hypothetical protein
VGRGHAKRVEPPIVNIADAPKPLPGEKSGEYIRRHLLLPTFRDADLLAGSVRVRFPGLKTTGEDVAYHWRNMEREGIAGLPSPWFKRRPRRSPR